MKKRRILSALTLLILLITIFAGCTQQQQEKLPAGQIGEIQEQLPQQGNGMEEVLGQIKVHFIDVGQGDCSLIQLPEGKNVLIDGGNRADYAIIKDYLDNQNVKTIDILIATHPHEDHIGALPEIINNFDIGSVYMPKVTANTKIFESLLISIKDKGLKVNTAKAGVSLIDTKDTKLTIIAPNSAEYEELNNYSAVSQLIYGNTSFLFMGDAEKESEVEILEKYSNLSSDLIKVGHHGGRTSTTKEFLARTLPKISILSLGKDNDYGHPHIETINRIDFINSKIFRTDEQGTIIASSDGNEITINKVPLNAADEQQEIVDFYIGNKNSKVFHILSCNSLPSYENQIKLISKAEAEQKGYSPCQRCKP